MNLQDEWAERVRLALEKGRPGNILTLAHDVPNRVERSQVLFTAAKALIGLCRYDAAEEILRETLSLDQDHRDARLHLGIVLENLGRISDAQHEIEKIRDDAYANADLGHVYRTLWRLKWRDQTGTTQDARQLARDNVILAAKAHDAFRQALEMDPRSYFSGLNAVLLLAIVDDLFDGKRPSEFGSDSVGDLIQIVSFIAQSAKRRAEQGSDDDDQFWSTTSLAALALLKGNEQEAHQLVRDACALPQTTLFQKEMLKVRLQLLQELGFKADFAGSAIGLIAKSTKKTKRYRNVILFYEHDTAPSGVQFTNDMADSIRQQIDDRLSRWNIGEGDLAICSPLREGDILFAEACRERKADVRLLVLDVPDVLGSNSSNWENRYQGSWASVGRELALQGGVGRSPDFDARESHNRWVLNTAHMEAYAESNSKLFRFDSVERRTYRQDRAIQALRVSSLRNQILPRYQGLVEAITAAKGEPPRTAVASV
jgi:tetratricopeptide (TPR) repeat protein